MPIPQGVPVSFQTLTDPMPFPITQPMRGNAGPFVFGSDVYSLCTLYDGGSNNIITAFKSTDNDATSPFTPIDSGIDVFNIGTVCAFYDRIGTLVYIGYGTDAGLLKFVTFDLSTGTFGTPNSSGITHSNLVDVRCVQTGTKVYLLWRTGATHSGVTYYDGATWADSAEFGSSTQVYDITLASDANHAVVWWGPFNQASINYSIMAGATIQSTVTAITFPVMTDAFINPYTFYNAYYDPAADISALTLPMYHNIAGFPEFQGLVVATTSLTPTFSFIDVADFAPGDTVGLSTTGGVLGGNWANDTFVVFWHLLRFSDSHSLVMFSQASSLAGPWGAATVYYDLQNDTPTPPPHLDNDSAPQSAVYQSDGQLGVTIGLDYHVGTTFFCGLLFTWALEAAPPPTPQTLTLIKIVNGGPAAPSDFTLTAVGGSPETEITGPGPQVGPTDVNAGTFELFESDPGGATWDGPNAKWDSPTFLWDGSGQYRPVWDCAGAPMPTPTSVVVSPGGGGAIPLGVTQVPDIDPTFAPLLSNGPFEFLVGGFLYQVLWNSGNRLGMFRRQASVGGSFTEIDATNAPTGISGYGRATLRGTVIAVCYMLPGNTAVKIVEFNTVSSGWGTPTASLALLSSAATFAFEKRSDGTYVFVAGRPNVVYYATNTGGTWSGTHILLTLGSGIVVIDGVIDSADRIWLLLNTNSTTVGLYALSSSYVLGSSVTTATLLFPGPPYPYIYYPRLALWSTDAVAVAYNTALTIGGAGVIRVKIATPLSSPSVTSYDVATVTAGTEQDYLAQPKDDGSGNLNLFYVHTNTGVVQVKQSTFDGASTWNTPSTFYDAVLDPPASGSASQAISTIDPVPSNGWAVGAAMQTDQPTEITTAEIIQESSGGGSSDVVCTVINYFTGPAPAPPGPGQMNPVGCFELLRVDATITPAKHLPTRGSVR